ncbi:MAG: primase-helicase zinc-binding domain-containing protein [Sideroxyarcus sp.]|nr:primase-helicase zinc-binding domain-containing protein [Sideroxyarcus sp.]
MLKLRTADEAVGRWPGILQTLGIDPAFLSNKHGPCPICAGKDRYRFDDKGGRGTWICSQCGAGDGFRLLQEVQGMSFSEAAKQVDRIVGTIQPGPIAAQRTDQSKIVALRTVWMASKAVTRGDPVWLYLNRRVGLEIVPSDLRFHPALRYTDADGLDLGRFPAMLAMMRYPDGAGASIHRTYLTEDGQKAAVPQAKKLMAGKPLNSSAVRLGPVASHIAIAEGVESALGAAKRFGVPVWAATNAALLESWVPPVGVERILIAGDNDAGSSWAGQAAAYNLAKRLVRQGYAVEVKIPGDAGKDWADES